MQSSEQMWAQSQGMHMSGGRAGGHMPMQGGMPMQMSGGYMVPGMMPGMMTGMPVMGGEPVWPFCVPEAPCILLRN